MRLSKKLFSISMFLFMVIYLTSCGIIPQSPKGGISGRVFIPPNSGELSKDITGWIPAVNASITIIDADGITHTVTTDQNGCYAFEDITVKLNTVITAMIPVDGNILILKDIVPQAVKATQEYDAGNMTPESTALALVVEALIAGGVNPLDIDLEEIESNDHFSDLVEKITAVLEEEGDVTVDPEVIDMVNNIINPPVPPSSPAPTVKVVNLAAIPGVTAPVAGETPVTAIIETAQYTGTVSWEPSDLTFDFETVYTATITLSKKPGYTFAGVPENFFTVENATTATNPANSGVATAEFPETGERGPIFNQTKNTYFNTIQSAIDASSSGDVIVVSAGTYKENIVIDNKNITLKSSDPADSAVVAATIIDGQDQDSVVKFLNGDTSTLEGFTIQNGDEPDYGGGGIFISGSSPVIRYNVIGDNIEDEVDTGNTGYCGGGICVVDDSVEPHIYENTIIGNNGYYGGGMYLGYGSPLVEGNIIKENESDYDGGGIAIFYSKEKGYCPTIRDNTIEYNVADNGGGIAVGDLGDAIIENNGINNNEAIFGGGIYVYYQADADIRGNNIIENNEAEHDGGGIYIFSEGIISITANTINNNTANIDSSSYSGGGIYVADGSPTIGGSTDTDTDNFNTICYNSPDQVDPDNYPNNDYCYFTFDETTKTITGYNIAGGVDVVIPTTIGGIPVEHIGDQAFQNKGLTSVTIPDSVTTIGDSAFQDNQLTSLTIGNNVDTIGYRAFYNNDLISVTIPDFVTTIGDSAFQDNQLTSLTLGYRVATIGGYAFYNNKLTSVTIPDNVKTIGSFSPHDGYTFANNQLTSINLGNSVATLGYGVFEGNQLTSVTIPNSVTTICDNVFKSNTLTSVTIGDGVYIVDSYSDTMGTNGGFLTAYSSGGAGTYNYNGSAWEKQ